MDSSEHARGPQGVQVSLPSENLPHGESDVRFYLKVFEFKIVLEAYYWEV